MCSKGVHTIFIFLQKSAVMKFKKITIVGLGLLGGSLGLEIRKKNLADTICGYARREATGQKAIARRIVDEFTSDLKQAVNGAELVVVCVPVMVAAQMFGQEDLFENFSGIVTDVCSTKKMLCEVAQENKNLADNYIGAHPMAGSEQSGIDVARQGLFERAVCLLTPHEGTDPDKLERVERFWRAVGCRINRVLPDEHDRLTAAVSHLPHLLANAFVDCVDTQGIDCVEDLAGAGFYDFTRIAGGSAPMWRDIFISNSEHVKNMLDAFIAQLGVYKKHLEAGDWDKLHESLENTANSKTKYLKKD